MAAAFCPQRARAQTAANPAPTAAVAASGPSVGVRRLDNGLTVVVAHSPAFDRSTLGVALSVPGGEARRGYAARWPAVLARIAEYDPPCDRAGVTSERRSDRAWTELVARAPVSALDAVLVREAQRLNALPSGEESGVRATHAQAFAPGNAVLAIVIATEHARALDESLARSVARVPSRPLAPSAAEEQREASAAWSASSDGEGQQWARSWSVVGDRSPDHYALELLAYSLRDARFGPLARLLQERSIRGAIASEVTMDRRAGNDQLRWSLRFTTPRANRPALDRVGDELLARIARDGMLGSDLRVARERWRRDWLSSQSTAESLALSLVRFEARWGNARLALTEADRYDAVTVQDVTRVLHEQLSLARTASTASDAGGAR